MAIDFSNQTVINSTKLNANLIKCRTHRDMLTIGEKNKKPQT